MNLSRVSQRVDDLIQNIRHSPEFVFYNRRTDERLHVPHLQESENPEVDSVLTSLIIDLEFESENVGIIRLEIGSPIRVYFEELEQEIRSEEFSEHFETFLKRIPQRWDSIGIRVQVDIGETLLPDPKVFRAFLKGGHELQMEITDLLVSVWDVYFQVGDTQFRLQTSQEAARFDIFNLGCPPSWSDLDDGIRQINNVLERLSFVSGIIL